MGRIGTRLRWVAMWTAALLLVAACTGGDNGDGADDTAAPSPEGAGTQADGSPVGLEVAPPPDLAGQSFVDNLLTREHDGEWTRGEGLVATLRLALGEADAGEVLRYAELGDYELTGIVAMAREYVASNTGDEASEITALLDRLVFSGERLAAMAGIGPETASHDDSVAAAAFQTAEQDCLAFFPKEHDTIAGGVGQCLEAREVIVLDVAGKGPYMIYAPAPELGSGGWQEKHYQLAAEAMAESIPILSELQALEPPFVFPPVNLVFSVTEGVGSALADPKAGQPCGVVLFTELLKPLYTDDDVKQIVAHELAHCFQTDRFPKQNEVPLEYTRWREEGMAQLLSNVVYPKNDLEWDPGRLDNLRKDELTTSLFDRAYTNSIFFQHLLSTGSIDALFDVIANLPTGPGHQEQKDALAGYSGMIPWHHEYAETLTDKMIIDSGGGFGAYAMTEQNFPTIDVTSPGTIIAANLEPFQVTRAHVVVPPGKQACLTWDDSNFSVTKRAHPIGPNGPEWEPLPPLLPPALDESRDVAVVVTARNPGPFTLTAVSVHDLDEETDGELVGTWIVQNTSLARKVDYIAPVQTVTSTSGRITVTFRSDGTVHMAYDGFTVAGYSDVQLQDGPYSSDFSRTYRSVTDAEGTDTYEYSGGDYVFYGSLSEGGFLNGTETVSETSQGVFFAIETDDIELETRLPESTVEDYPASGWAILGAANQVRFACGGHVLLLDDVVLRRADG